MLGYLPRNHQRHFGQLPANCQEVWFERHVDLDEVAIDLQCLVVEHPRAVFFVAAVFHQRRKGAELSPTNEQLFGPTKHARTGAITANVRAKVHVAVPCTMEVVLQCSLQAIECRVLVTNPACLRQSGWLKVSANSPDKTTSRGENCQ